MSTWIVGGVLSTVALGAMWFDVRERRIPNSLTLAAFAAALAFRAFEGLSAVGLGLVGAFLCFLLALPFFLVGGMGGGDVKLLTAFGAFLGPERLAAALLVTAFAGGALAMCEMVRRRAVRRTLWNLRFLLSTAPRALLGRAPRSRPGAGSAGRRMTLSSPGAVTVPYGVAISAGALFGWFF